MKVRRLEINGFKSFADRSTLDFPDGMCAVVGPNGCGKSNVVDAIRWVLGEQSAKQLRGHAMEDVLFNGSDARKTQGLAEVSLTFENDGQVAHPRFADMAEIMITRRLYRSGDSEYLINKMPARLKDIQQLLMDTGLGNRAYAIIEQGRVAAFIEARPEDRRLWLEEAAGITRYKNQKKVALRKMQSAQDNMNRLMDIVLEVEAQMRRLERQSQKAQRYQKLRAEIRDLDLNIASHEFERLQNELGQTKSESEAVGAQLLLANQRVTGLETDLETLKVRLIAAEQEISEAGERKLATQGEMQKSENELTLLGREAENQKRLSTRYAQEKDSLAQGLAERERDLAKAQRLGRSAREKLDQSRESVDRARSEAAELMESVRVQEAMVDDSKQAVVDHMSRTSQVKNREADLDRRQADIQRRLETLAGRSRSLEEELAVQDEARRQAASSVEDLKDSQADQEERLAVLEEERLLAGSRHKEATAREQETTRRRHELASLVDAMEMSLSSYDWAGDGVRELLKASKSGDLGVEALGLVLEHLEVEPGKESLVEAALGSALQAVVVKDGASARALAAWAAEKGLGRLGVVSLEELKPGQVGAPAGSTPLSGLAKPAPGFEPLNALLEGMGCAENFDGIWSIGMAPGQKVVDRNGNRLERPGQAVLGQGQNDSVLARRNDLEAKRGELAIAEEELREATSARQSAEARLSALEEEAQVIVSASRELERNLAQREKELFRLEESIRVKDREIEALSFDRGEIDREMERLEQDRESLAKEAAELSGKGAGLEEDLRRAQAMLAEAREELELARGKESEARLAQASLSGQAEHAEQEVSRLTREVEAVNRRIGELGREMEQARQTVATLGERRQQEELRLGRLVAELDEQEEAHRRARELHSQAQMRLNDLEGSLKQSRSEQRQVEGESQDLLLRKKQIQMARENLCEQIMDRCRVDLENDHKQYLPEGSFDPESRREKLNKLRQRLAKLGPVNLEAISEHQALSERHEFLTGQKEDLDASLADLRKAIRKINKSSRARFMETLEAGEPAVSSEVYPGAVHRRQGPDWSPDEGVDPLEAGMYLMVELPGKKVKTPGGPKWRGKGAFGGGGALRPLS